MNSVIDKKVRMGDVFAKYPVNEVFATSPFDFENELVHMFVIITKSTFDWYDLWLDMVKIYKLGTLVSVVHNYDDPVLMNTQLIWKDGTWYV